GLTNTRRSKRPGRRSAGSRISGRLVAPSTITPSAPVKPSISVRIWLSVCSRSSCPPNDAPPPRARPIASSSSMKMIAGAACFAWLKRSRTRLAPTPTIASMNSDAEIEKNGTSASPATARASSAGARRSGQEHALRDGSAHAQVAVRVAQEVDHLDQLLLGLVDPRHVAERGALGGVLVAAGARAAELAEPPASRAPAPGPHGGGHQ